MTLTKTPICNFGEKAKILTLRLLKTKKRLWIMLKEKMEHSLCSFVTIAHM